MDRRAFLRKAGTAGAGTVLGSIPLLSGCKGASTPSQPDPSDQVQVDLAFTIYNHTKGPRGSFVKNNVLSGSKLLIPVSELMSQYGINDVDDKAIIIKAPNLGSTMDRSFDGIGKLTVPRQDTAYDIFLLNADGKGLYAPNEAQNNPFHIRSRTPVVYRRDFDGHTGEERIFGGEFIPEIGDEGIIDQFNKALNPVGIPYSYGSITRKPAPNDGIGVFGYGFGDCHGYDAVAAIPGDYAPIYWIGIDTRVATTVSSQVGAGLGALLEMVTFAGFLYLPGIRQRAQQIIQSEGVLTQRGKDFIAYFYVR